MKKTDISIGMLILLFLISITAGVSYGENSKEYSYSESGFSVEFPSSWTVKKNTGGCQGKPEGYFAAVQIINVGDMETGLEEFFVEYRKEMKSQLSKDYREVRVEDLTIGGSKAKLLAFTTIEKDLEMKGFFYIVKVKNTCYQILTLTNKADEGKAVPIFNSIIKSIKFLKSV